MSDGAATLQPATSDSSSPAPRGTGAQRASGARSSQAVNPRLTPVTASEAEAGPEVAYKPALRASEA